MVAAVTAALHNLQPALYDSEEKILIHSNANPNGIFKKKIPVVKKIYSRFEITTASKRLTMIRVIKKYAAICNRKFYMILKTVSCLELAVPQRPDQNFS